MRAVCNAKLKFLVIILANESNVHCKIEIFSHHFCQLEQCALYILKFQTIILPHESSVRCKIEISSHHYTLQEHCALQN